MNRSHLVTALFAVIWLTSVGVTQAIETQAIDYSFSGRRELRATTPAFPPSQRRATSPVSYTYPVRGHTSSNYAAFNTHNVNRYVSRGNYPVHWGSPHGVAYRRPPGVSNGCTGHNRTNVVPGPVTPVGFADTHVPRASYATTPSASSYYVGEGILGQPKLYHAGQPIRNVLRYVFP